MRPSLRWLSLLVLCAACDRERREFSDTPPDAGTHRSAHGDLDGHVSNTYLENSYSVAEGKRLFTWMNCSGCHSFGGGGIGPPLMDSIWMYGGEPEDIYRTISEGRPNGMPSFGERLPNQQIWQLVAYVRTLSGNAPRAARSGRADDMSVKSSEQNQPTLEPQRARDTSLTKQ